MESEYLLEIKNISKEFPGVKALDNVSFYLKRGEIHALVGENGAGKSTLMKILAGIYNPDSGEIIYDGQPFTPKKPVDALNKGVAMVHQELDLVPEMTVCDNVFSGQELTNGIIVDRRKMIRRTRELMDSLGIDINPSEKIKNLSTAQQQMVAIIRAIAFDAEVIIMDEPTSAITDREVEHLFEIIRKMKKANKSIIYISHKMDEIYSLTDRITVLRDGQLIGSNATADIDSDKLINMMVGRELKNVYTKTENHTKEFDSNEVILKVDNLTRENEFYDISFEVKRGEILGFFGLMGAGRTEIMDTIFGINKADKGIVKMNGKEIKTIKDAIKAGIAYVTEDRKETGLNLIGSVKDNMCIAYMDMVTKSKVFMSAEKEKYYCDDLIEKLNIKCSSRDTQAGTLSGGNQQKIVLAKWFMGDPELLIMDEPTRGIDIGAKSEIYKLMDAMVNEGKSIIMISSETPELLGMSDRVVVMHEGIKTGEFRKDQLNQELLMACAIGENDNID